MTEAEAIVELEHLTNQWANDEDMYSPFMKYEVDQKFINAVYVAKNALEKQIAKKPVIKSVWSVAKCPCCDADLGEYINDGYPKNWESLKFCDCGQRLNREAGEV